MNKITQLKKQVRSTQRQGLLTQIEADQVIGILHKAFQRSDLDLRNGDKRVYNPEGDEIRDVLTYLATQAKHKSIILTEKSVKRAAKENIIYVGRNNGLVQINAVSKQQKINS